MTSWTSPRTWVAAAILTAAQLNVDIRDNLSYVKEVLAGTNADKINGEALSHPLSRTGSGNESDGIRWFLSGTKYAYIQPITTSGIALTYNGTFGGTTWSRLDTADLLNRLQVDNTGMFFGTAAAGSNPATITEAWFVDLNGKMRGAGIYASGEVGISNGATSNFTHGLAARPRWVGGFYNTVSGTEDSLTNPINVGVGSTGVAITTGAVTSTIITVSNNSGAGIAARVYAIL